MEKNTVIWTLVYTKAKQEIRAKKHLENQGFLVFLPIISIEQGSKKSISEKLEAMFPIYIVYSTLPMIMDYRPFYMLVRVNLFCLNKVIMSKQVRKI